MDRETAFDILGLSPSATPLEIARAFGVRHAELTTLERDAPTDALRAKYTAALADLDTALALLQGEPSPAPAAAPASIASANPLTQSKVADLPLSEPGQAGAGFEAGEILGERFELLSELGRGGMGVVYKAFDRHRQEEVALKVLLPHLLASPDARQRFLDEVRVAGNLSHPNIVRVFDIHRFDETDCLTMELLEGETLRQDMERRASRGQPYTLDEVKSLLKSLCETLTYAHGTAVHRDIKPENIWLAEDGTVKLMDFGLAKVMTASQLAQSGTAMGTAYYMAPEQLTTGKPVDGRADQYAVAALAYELLTGGVPAGRMESLGKSATNIPGYFSTAIDKALSQKPEGRFEDMAAFGAALKLGHAGLSVSVPWQQVAKVAGIVLALGLGGVLASQIDWADLLPMSEEERRANQSAAVQLEGEVKALAKELEQREEDYKDKHRRLQQEQDELKRELRRDRNSGKAGIEQELAAIQEKISLLEEGWALRRQGVHNSETLRMLNASLLVGSNQIEQQMYIEARQTFERIKPQFEWLLDEDEAADELLDASNALGVAQGKYERETEGYELSDPAQTLTEATEFEQNADQSVSAGEFKKALDLYREATQNWNDGLVIAEAEIERIKKRIAAEKAARPPKLYLELSPYFLVDFEHNGVIRLLKLELKLMAHDQKVLDQVNSQMTKVREAVIRSLSAYDLTVTGSTEGKYNLQRELAEAINKSLRLTGNKSVREAVITQFVLQ